MITQQILSYLGSFYTGYNIIDKIKKEDHSLEVLSPIDNSILITEEGVYWEPKKQDVGVNKFNIQLSDGIAKTTGVSYSCYRFFKKYYK